MKITPEIVVELSNSKTTNHWVRDYISTLCHSMDWVEINSWGEKQPCMKKMVANIGETKLAYIGSMLSRLSKVEEIESTVTVDFALQTIFKKGKYKGYTVEYVANLDLSYLKWCLDTGFFINKHKVDATGHQTFACHFSTDSIIGRRLTEVLKNHFNHTFENLEAVKQEKIEFTNLRSDFIGTVGETMEFEGTYVHSIGFDTRFGISFMHFFLVGNSQVVWQTQSTIQADKGTEFKFKAKVKEHSTYRNAKQTKVSHLKIC